MTTLNISKTYEQLETFFYAWLCKNCSNIDNLDRIDESLKADFEGILHLEGTGSKSSNPGSTVGFRIKNSTAVTAVPLSTVSTLFTKFMRERNIGTKKEKVLTTNGILNFWNNVAAFCIKYCLFVNSSYSNKQYLIFSTKAADNISITKNIEEEMVTAKNIDDAFASFEKALKASTRIQNCIYEVIPYSSCCSSSCSSSSCSSCSCSSIFIGYMKLR